MYYYNILIGIGHAMRGQAKQLINGFICLSAYLHVLVEHETEQEQKLFAANVIFHLHDSTISV